MVNDQYNLGPVPKLSRRLYDVKGIKRHFSFSIEASRSVEADIELVKHYDKLILELEYLIKKHARVHRKKDLKLLLSIRGINYTIALTIIYELYDVVRFNRVQDFSSYSRLVRCKHTSAGKVKGEGNPKAGNPHLKWIFCEAGIHVAQHNPSIGEMLKRLEKKHGIAKGKTVLANKVARAVYFMLKNRVPFDEKKFLGSR
jgi:transposase